MMWGYETKHALKPVRYPFAVLKHVHRCGTTYMYALANYAWFSGLA